MPYTKNDFEIRVRGNKLNLTNLGLFSNHASTITAVVNEKNVEHLILYCNNLDDDSSKTIAECQNLKSLDLSFNNFTDLCLSDILRIPTLQRLDLSRTCISDEGIDVILEIKPSSLIFINLNRTEVTQEGKNKLENALNAHQSSRISLRM